MLIESLPCPICRDPYEDPVILSKCGHSFCRTCLAAHIASAKKKVKPCVCPTCRTDFDSNAPLTPNYALKDFVAALHATATPTSTSPLDPNSSPLDTSPSTPITKEDLDSDEVISVVPPVSAPEWVTRFDLSNSLRFVRKIANTWIPFSARHNAQIIKSITKHNPNVELVCDGEVLRFNLDDSKIRATSSIRKRPYEIEFRSQCPHDVDWMFETCSTPHYCAINFLTTLEAKYSSKTESSFTIKHGDYYYDVTLDFENDNHFQVNTNTGTRRKLIRKIEIDL
ncbi:hypothetical protein RCL1_005578 [Eukaryota sp. TZLM3-RCL]